MASSRKGEADLPGQVLARLRDQVPAGGRLTVGFSGGLDSTVLLHLLAQLRPAMACSLDALHVHHGLSPHADAWANHCRVVCQGLGVPLEVRHVRVELRGEGPEAAARTARYGVFAGWAGEAIALAHHRDDQAETVLAQLLRGGGVRGLAAMPASRPLPGGRVRLLRPLLDVSRGDLLAWARLRGLTWVEDESNENTGLTRNALRRDTLPALEARFPGTAAGLAESAAGFAEAARLLDDLADLDARDILNADGLDVARLARLAEPRARNLLRRYLESTGAEIHARRLREGLRQLLSARPDAGLRVDFGARALVRFAGRAQLASLRGVPEPLPELCWAGEERLQLADGAWLVFRPVAGEGVRLAPGQVTVRYRRGGEKLRPGAGRPRRPVKALMREAAIPPWRRNRLPFVYTGERLVWVAGLGPDADLRAGPGEAGWLISLDMPS